MLTSKIGSLLVWSCLFPQGWAQILLSDARPLPPNYSRQCDRLAECKLWKKETEYPSPYCCPDDAGIYKPCCTPNDDGSWVVLASSQLSLFGIVVGIIVCCSGLSRNGWWFQILCERQTTPHNADQPGEEDKRKEAKIKEISDGMSKALQNIWTDIPDFPKYGFTVLKCPRHAVKISYEDACAFEELKLQKQGGGDLIDYRGREISMEPAVWWLQNGVFLVWLPLCLPLPAMIRLLGSCPEKGLPSVNLLYWVPLVLLILGKLYCEARALVYTLPSQIFLTRDIDGTNGTNWHTRFFGKLNFLNKPYLFWRAVMTIYGLLSTVSLFKNILFFGQVWKLEHCLHARGSPMNNDASKAFEPLWFSRVPHSLLGQVWWLLRGRYPSLLEEALLLYAFMFLQPIFGALFTVEEVDDKDEQTQTKQLRRRITRRVLTGSSQFNSSVIGTLADLGHMASINFWDTPIAQRNPFFTEEFPTHDQTEWVFAENRDDQVQGVRVWRRPTFKLGEEEAGKANAMEGTNFYEYVEEKFKDSLWKKGCTVNVTDSAGSKHEITWKEDKVTFPPEFKSPPRFPLTFEVHPASEHYDRGIIHEGPEKAISVKRVNFCGTDYARKLIRRQMLRGMHKFLLAGFLQSQFCVHLQLDVLSLCKETWEGDNEAMVVLTILMNFCVAFIRLSTAKELVKLLWAARKKAIISFWYWGGILAVSLSIYVVSLIYCALKLRGLWVCESSFWTLFKGCTVF